MNNIALRIFAAEAAVPSIDSKLNEFFIEESKKYNNNKILFIGKKLAETMIEFSRDDLLKVYEHFKNELLTGYFKTHEFAFFILNIAKVKETSINMNVENYVHIITNLQLELSKLEVKKAEHKIEHITDMRGTPSELFTCPKCGNKKCRTQVNQVRAGDEGATLFIYCTNKSCLNEFVEGQT
jgi:DNA-directed RNA polymerase subunit M/transcription elongation factor TFIIS